MMMVRGEGCVYVCVSVWGGGWGEGCKWERRRGNVF